MPYDEMLSWLLFYTGFSICQRLRRWTLPIR